MTSPVVMRASSITLLNSYPPTVAIGLKRNECRPGAGKPHPSDMIRQLQSKASWVWSALTAGSFGVTHGYGNLVVSARHGAAVRHGTGVTYVGAAGGHLASR